MKNENLRPSLRAVEIFPFQGEGGKPLFALRDPEEISRHVLALSPEAACALQFLDGTRTLEEVRAAYRQHWKREFPSEHLAELVRVLDEACFLVSEGFQRQFESQVEAFQKAAVRAAHHAGSAYPADPFGLHESLSGYFAPPRGPGYPNGTGGGREIRGMIVPHIDLRLGGHCYAWAYKELAEAAKPDVVVVLGTGHNGLKGLYSVTRKDFETPLGRIPVDSEFIDRLAALYSYDIFSGEFAHRKEHTIEFQALFLQLLYGNSVSLVPVLCSFGYWMVTQGETGELIRSFVEALRTALGQDKRRICVVASADLAHVGPHYGDKERFDGERAAPVHEADRQMLVFAQQLDGDGFLNYIAREEDRRRICGLSPIYTLLKSLDAAKGTLLSHDHGQMDEAGSICSFASLVFES